MFRLPFCSLILLLGCSCAGTTKLPKAPSFFHDAKAGVTMQTGDAAKPANVSTRDTTTEIPFPPGSVITVTTPVNADSPYSSDNKSLPVVKITERGETISTPVSFAPPAPPSPSDIAKGRGVLVFYYVGGFLALAACALAYLEHGKAAVVAGIGAVAVPCVANFLSSEWALRICVAVVCISGAFFVAWQFVKKKIVVNT